MKQHKYHQREVFRLSSSVGECGFNDPDEVGKLQQKIKIQVTHLLLVVQLILMGDVPADTIEAIRWHQSLINMPASGLVHPTDIWFMEALENATAMRWRERPTGGPLLVQEGQLTFDYEGVDYITAVEPFRQPARMPWFSRILHHPSSDSGVTLGRGYDMKKRSAGSILYTLRQSGLEEYKAQICAKAAYLQGKQASDFIKVYGPLVGGNNASAANTDFWKYHIVKKRIR